jgi:hypothetical protein|tara:strand:+ start:1170 stop:1589 length:420 start_codon:yes stop_codon:yes gene_type:complete
MSTYWWHISKKKKIDEENKSRNKESKQREKFMSTEETKQEIKIAEPKQKIQVDLEVDTSIKDLGINPYAKLIHMARAIDAWRIFPRLFLTVYIVLLYKCVIWYMDLSAPTMEQSGLISIVVGAGAAWFGLYTGSSKGKK